MPTLISAIAVIVLGVAGVGAYVLLANRSTSSPSSAPTTQAPPITASPTTPTAPSTTVPVTTTPTVSPPQLSGFTTTTNADVWLKAGPGSAYGNVALVPSGNQVLVSCYNPNGQPDTTSSGITNAGWYRTVYNGNGGWISENYLNTQGAQGISDC